jgi:argininosuccinate lyase
MPFRQAHEVVGSAVQYCVKKGKTLEALSVKELKRFSELLDQISLDYIKLEECLRRRSSIGGTSPQQVAAQVETARHRMDGFRAECHGEIDRLEVVWADLRK